MKNRALAVFICCLLLAGCGMQGNSTDSAQSNTEDSGQTVAGQEAEEHERERNDASAAEGKTESVEQPAEESLCEMELLEADDPENTNLADLLQRTGAGMMVRIEADGLLGSGVIYQEREGKLLILTAAHLLENATEDALLTFADGWQTVSGDYECFELADLAVVRLEVDSIPAEHRANYLCANVDKDAFDAVRAGDGCIAMGCRSGVAAEAYEGNILEPWIFMEDYGQYMIWARAEGMPGLSCGGLFDSQGHFLGILSGTDGEGELAVVPLSLILPLDKP